MLSSSIAPITVAVDPANPGQFLACCGLLELADRFWPGAEGWFSHDNQEFYIQGEQVGCLREVIEKLIQHPPTAIEQLDNGLPVKPIIAPLRIQLDQHKHIVLDSWARVGLDKGKAVVMGNSPWNLWSGNQKSAGLWSALRAQLRNQLNKLTGDGLEELLSQRLFQKGRFGFDPGPAWNALDAGFSPNEQDMQVQSSPSVELLAAVGLQRFRPLLHRSKVRFDYFSWHSPLAPIVAATAFTGGLRNSKTRRYCAAVLSRGEYAALGFAFEIPTGDSNE